MEVSEPRHLREMKGHGRANSDSDSGVGPPVGTVGRGQGCAFYEVTARRCGPCMLAGSKEIIIMIRRILDLGSRIRTRKMRNGQRDSRELSRAVWGK